MPRPVAAIDVSITQATIRRRSRIAARDRRQQDMLTAMQDVEKYEREIAADDVTIDRFLDERHTAVVAAQMQRDVDALVNSQ